MMGHSINKDAFHPNFRSPAPYQNGGLEGYKMYFCGQSSIRKSKARLLVALCLLHSFPHRPVLNMLSRNLVIASVAVVFLASTVSTAPVEDKEPEENDFEAEEGEEELSEEEEDDDDSKGQHMKGAGSQQATAAPKGLGMTPGSAVAGESPNGSNGRDGYSRPSGSSSHDASYGGQDASKSEIVPPGTDGGVHSASISVVSSGQGSSGQGSSGHIAAGHGSTMISSHTFGRPSAGQTSDGSEGFTPHTDGSQYENGETAHDGSQIESPEIPETESNGNGHKLLNGGETGFTGLDHFMAGTSQIPGTVKGILNVVSQNGLRMSPSVGGIGESFGPDTQTDGLGTLLDLLDTPPDVPPTCLVTDAISTDHMGLAFQVDSAAAGLSPGHPSSGGPVLDAPPGTSDNGAHSKSPADTTDSLVVFDTMSHPGHSFIDYSDGGADNNGADLPDKNGNGNGRHKPVVDIQKGGTGHQGAATEMHHTAGAAGDPVTDGQTQTDMTGQGHLAVTDGMPNYTGNHISSTHPDTCQSITHASVSCVVCVSKKQILCMRLGLDLQMPQRHIVAWFRQIYQSQGIHSQGFPHRQMPWVQLQLNLKGLSEVQANLVLRNRHSQLVQKMWNWKIPADFHMKPRVRFLRYRFQCTDQYAWQRNREPAR
ncbi:hypothetical protein H4Q32_006466 [Labeo rohita]|uniref:Uncharacterized protein n=1 Tax=Labeo rohita TaxID=84645 RepID=A0ABQ8LRW1_LABRO|nr:hypothetical protein H4Q32_006466 [Labeo rohita]